jgi:hypothetical protein
MPLFYPSRRKVIAGLASLPSVSMLAVVPIYAAATQATEESLLKSFNYLNENGNSNCSGKFLRSIATMPAGARLQGSCCAPMDAHRYVEQVHALSKFSTVPEIPPNPYDVPAELAQKLMIYYDKPLSSAQQMAYDFAMEKSDEQGPCCCKCWRWHVYGGLGKYLILEKRFDGPRLVEVWNLSSGCGGGAEHHH